MWVCSVQLKLSVVKYQENIENLFIFKIAPNRIFLDRKQHKNWAKSVSLRANRKKRMENLKTSLIQAKFGLVIKTEET